MSKVSAAIESKTIKDLDSIRLGKFKKVNIDTDGDIWIRGDGDVIVLPPHLALKLGNYLIDMYRET